MKLKIKRRGILAVILAVAMTVTSIPCHAFAEEKTLSDIQITQKSQEYYQGQPFHYENITVNGLYNDGKSEEIKDYGIEGFDPEKTGSQVVKVVYKEFSKDLSVNVRQVDVLCRKNASSKSEWKTDTEKNVQWENSNDTVLQITKRYSKTETATVGESSRTAYTYGVEFTGLQTGISTVTCRDKESGQSLYSAVVSVSNPAESLSLDKNEMYLKVGGTASVKASVHPADADDAAVLWTSGAPQIASVDGSGTITGLAVGTAEIRARLKNGAYPQKCSVQVVEPTRQIQLEKEQINLHSRDESCSINAKVLPENATVKDLIYTSEDETIAVVDSNGNVSVKRNGETTVTITSKDGFSSASVRVVAEGLTEGIFVSDERIDFKEAGQKHQLKASVLPETASDKTIRWKSADESIASVDDAGLVTAVAEGETTITAISADEEFVKEIPVKVHPLYEVIYSYCINEDSGYVVKREWVKWGDSIEIQPIEYDRYSYNGTYEEYSPRTGYTKRIMEGTKLQIKRDRILYCSYTPNRVQGVTLKITGANAEDSTFSVCAVSDPKWVLNEKHTITCHDPEIFSFSDGSASMTVDGYDSWTPLLSIKKEGTAVLSVKTDDGGCTDSLKITTKKDENGNFYIQQDITPSLKVQVADPNRVEFTVGNHQDGFCYRIYQILSNGKKKEIASNLLSNSNKQMHAVKYGQTYEFCVRIEYANGTFSRYSKPISRKITFKPTITAASSGYNSNKISVNQVGTEDDWPLYQFYRSTDKKKWSLIAEQYERTGMNDKKLTCGKTYYYKVRVKVSGVTTEYSAVKSCKPVPAAPAKLSLTSGKKKITIKWSKTSGASGYQLYRATSQKGTYKLIRTLTKGSSVKYTNTKLTSKKRYYYKVRAYKIVNKKKIYGKWSAIKYAAAK